MEVNFYELGKWYGDRVGFPRVGLVNKQAGLIVDSFEFLKTLVDRKRITMEIQRRNSEIDIQSQLEILSKLAGISPKEILITTNKHMKGDYIFRVFTQSRVIFRKFDAEVLEVKKSKNMEIAQFLAGVADAEATIDTRNQIVSYSISNKKREEAEMLKNLLEKVLCSDVKIRTAGKLELKLDIHRKDFYNFKEKVGRFMKHNEKIKRLSNNFVSDRDKIYLQFIELSKNADAKSLSEKFRIHEDSARRILRQFKRQNFI